ncbi:MAG TPA: acetyl-CoA carboxylase carboxyl transferase subunit alpha, partial [Sporolactobacillaceae bacterium]|nr:acetyl-CoA carboxylase carboxyl transferase subunit alpha [Sporolactobacillaceae bacterium]
MVPGLEFEKPIIELRNKIRELEEFMATKDIDLSDELESLQNRLRDLEDQTYENISPWDRVQLARHMNRPTTLDYIPHLFTDFLEMHGDRLYGDDEAIVAGVANFHGRP